jgi:hypothetical protein
MNISIQPVEINFIQRIWPLVEGYLQSALDKGEGPADYNIHHVQMFLTSGQWLLVVAVDEDNVVHGAMTVSFINYPMSRVAFITATGGKGIVNSNSLEQLKSIVQARGATKLQAFGRDSMVKLLGKSGFEPRTTLVEVTI